ncbi:MAG TPA: hypothetical protein ACFYD4_09335 [Candidatus Wunengus sp. YC61]|uniref:hypothetical protein n=1 Tax=Candidatus Wunengus sp. YC61 TaxID=3367698 RepID=UPI00402608AE
MSVTREIREQVSRVVGPGVGEIIVLSDDRTGTYARKVTGRGTSQGSICTTLAAAVTASAASQNDVILAFPGSYAIPVSFEMSKANVTVLGVGYGTARPIFTYADTAYTITVSAANVAFRNLQFQNGIDALVAGFTVSGAGFQLLDCDLSQPTSTNDALIWVLTSATADDMLIQRNRIRASHAGPTEAVRLVGADRAMILDNFMMGSWSTAAINGITTLSAEILIARNVFSQSVTDALVIDLVAACTGRIEYNTGTVTSTGGITASNIIDAANCQLAENYFSDAAGETAKLIGTVSA